MPHVKGDAASDSRLIVKLRPAGGWVSDGACFGQKEAYVAFFGEDDSKKELAIQAFCLGGCPVRADCLHYALQNSITVGVWGGIPGSGLERIRRRAPRVGALWAVALDAVEKDDKARSEAAAKREKKERLLVQAAILRARRRLPALQTEESTPLLPGPPVPFPRS